LPAFTLKLLTNIIAFDMINLSSFLFCTGRKVRMGLNDQDQDEKLLALKQARALNPRPQAVIDPAFTGGEPFFDARDLVQVKYEMLRRVHLDGQAINTTAAAFGFSRPSFYATQAAWHTAGLSGLMSARPGPKGGHKLTQEIVSFLEEYLAQHPRVPTARLLEVLYEHFGLQVHPRTLERALSRHNLAKGTLKRKKFQRASPQ
jgi:transposase